MKFNRTFSLSGGTQPTWELVVLMIMMLAVETVGDLSGCVGPKPDYEACWSFCDGAVEAVSKDECKCYQEAE